jgi:hypothetical protein
MITEPSAFDTAKTNSVAQNMKIGSCVLRTAERGRLIQISSFALPNSFSAVPRSLGLVFMFCATGPIFGGTKGVRFNFHVLCSWTHFRAYQGRQIIFSCFALPDPFSTVMRVPRTVFMFCTSELIFDGTEGVVSSFHVLRFRTHFRRQRG